MGIAIILIVALIYDDLVKDDIFDIIKKHNRDRDI